MRLEVVLEGQELVIRNSDSIFEAIEGQLMELVALKAMHKECTEIENERRSLNSRSTTLGCWIKLLKKWQMITSLEEIKSQMVKESLDFKDF